MVLQLYFGKIHDFRCIIKYKFITIYKVFGLKKKYNKKNKEICKLSFANTALVFTIRTIIPYFNKFIVINRFSEFF